MRCLPHAARRSITNRLLYQLSYVGLLSILTASAVSVKVLGRWSLVASRWQIIFSKTGNSGSNSASSTVHDGRLGRTQRRTTDDGSPTTVTKTKRPPWQGVASSFRENSSNGAKIR